MLSEPNSLPPINANDLTDPSVFRLNDVLRLLASQITSVQDFLDSGGARGPAGPPGNANPTLVTINDTPVPGASQTTSNLKGDHISVKMFGAIDDYDGTTGTDNTAAIQAALDSLVAGQTLYFPAGGTGQYLITDMLQIPQGAAGTKGITIQGADVLHCQIVYVGTAVVPCVINMIGCDSVTWQNIAVLAWGNDPAFFPKTVLMLGRYPDTDAYGHHAFRRVAFMGNVSVAVVYSIASEENNWDDVFLFSNNGKDFAGTAKIVYYTSYQDDLGICVPTVIPESNLDIWHSHVHYINFGPGDPDNVCVYEQMYAGAGDHTYKDSYMSPSARGTEEGWAFRFTADPVYAFSGSNYVIEALRIENSQGMFDFKKGTGPGLITGIRAEKNTLSLLAGEFMHGEDGCLLYESSFKNNFCVAPDLACPSSVDLMQNCIFISDDNQDFTVRTIASLCFFHLSSGIVTLSLAVGSFNNFIILSDTSTMNGPITVDGGNAFVNDTVAMQLTTDPDDRSISLYYDGSNGLNILFHYDSGGPTYGAISTSDNNTPLSLTGDTVQIYASTGSLSAGQALTILVNKLITNFYGRIWIDASVLTEPIIVTRDANGTTTGFSVVHQEYGGTSYFGIFGGTDATNPGTLQTRNHIPFADDTYDSGNAGLLWKKIWTHDLLIADLASDGPLRGSSGDVVYGPVDVNNAGDIAATGFSSGDYAKWNGTEFIPGTGATIPYLTANCSGTLTCSTSYADVTGATVTLTGTGNYLITASCDIALDVTANQVLVKLVINGVDQTGIITVTLATGTGSDSIGGMYARTWIYNNSGSNVAKLQGKKFAAGGTGVVNVTATNITAIFLG